MYEESLISGYSPLIKSFNPSIIRGDPDVQIEDQLGDWYPIESGLVGQEGVNILGPTEYKITYDYCVGPLIDKVSSC